jgi:DNA-directed RNA polymerase specialized sigma24 family protein
MVRDWSGDETADADGSVVVLHPLARTEVADFEPVYVRHHGDVYPYLLVLTRSAEDAEDMTAETFERALRAWPDLGSLHARPLP